MTVTRAQLDSTREALDGLVKAVGILQRIATEPHSPEKYASESPAARAAAREETRLPVEWAAWFQAWTLVLSAVDHISALDRALAPGHLLTFAPWTIARTILEATNRAAWLLDQDIPETERTARCLGLLRQGVKAQKRIAKAFNNGELVAEHQAILKDITALSRIMRLTPSEPSGENVLGASRDYHLLSGSYHQNQGIHQVLSQGRHEPAPNTVVFQIQLTLGQTHYLLRSPVQWFGVAVWRYFAYCGLDLNRLEAVLAEAGGTAGLPERFWEHRNATSP